MEKMIWSGIFVILVFILMPIVSAAPGFSIELKPHFFFDGKEIMVYNNETAFDGISFEVIGNNLNDASRVVNLTITKLSPDIGAFFQNNTQTLISGQRKILWVSEIIDTSIFNYSEPLSVIVGVNGFNEVPVREFYREDQIEIKLNNPELQKNFQQEKSFFESFGNWVWEGNPTYGLITTVLVIFTLTFVWWRYKMGNQLNKWREGQEQKKYE